MSCLLQAGLEGGGLQLQVRGSKTWVHLLVVIMISDETCIILTTREQMMDVDFQSIALLSLLYPIHVADASDLLSCFGPFRISLHALTCEISPPLSSSVPQLLTFSCLDRLVHSSFHTQGLLAALVITPWKSCLQHLSYKLWVILMSGSFLTTSLSRLQREGWMGWLV